ncbi:MAG: DUF1194 domain-containing protein [Pseudomonadota bacterium]
MRHLVFCLLAPLLAAAAPPKSLASQTTAKVDVELVIAVDVSGSMSDHEHETQRKGFLAAFEDQRLINAIRSGLRGRIAVTYIEWANHHSQQVLVPWRIVSDRASAKAFRDELATKPRSPIRGTSISGALSFAAGLFDGNGIESFRRVIDVSGDGANRTGPFVEKVRDAVVAKGIIINGLPIMLSPMVNRRTHGYGLDHYFQDCVIGGPSAFVYPVLRDTELVEAIRRKLILELSTRPDGKPPLVHVAGENTTGAIPVQLPGRRNGQKADCQVGRRYEDDW